MKSSMPTKFLHLPHLSVLCSHRVSEIPQTRKRSRPCDTGEVKDCGLAGLQKKFGAGCRVEAGVLIEKRIVRDRLAASAPGRLDGEP